MKKISITGTKGKTTVVNVIAATLLVYQKNVLQVDTTGHFLNGKRRSSLEDSKQTWNLVPTVAPGRYLFEFLGKESESDVAVLECALGSSSLSGLGYRNHDVGVFLNVFEDHLGSSERLQTKADIADAKDFIFRRIDRNGYAVFNADDELVCSKLSVIPEHIDITKVPCGLDFSYFDLETHLKDGGVAITVRGDYIVLLSKKSEKKIIRTSDVAWTFGGHYQPSVWNLLHIVGALYGYFGGKLPTDFAQVLASIKLDSQGGRLTMLRGENGTRILIDYAHEKVSLEQIGDLAKKLAGEQGKAIGVVRLAYDRTDDLIQETGEAIANHFDEFVVYDKIDGHFRNPTQLRSQQFTQVVGRVSGLFAEAIKKVNPNVTRILREDEAAEYAASISGPHDVVIYIVNDDINRSIEFVKKAFKADFDE